MICAPVAAYYLVVAFLSGGGSLLAIPMSDAEHCARAAEQFQGRVVPVHCVASGFPTVR